VLSHSLRIGNQVARSISPLGLITMSQLPSQVWSPRRNGYQGPLYNCESVKGCLGTAIVDKVEEVEVGEGGINLGGAEEGGEEESTNSVSSSLSSK